jgi:hypothetical protein
MDAFAFMIEDGRLVVNSERPSPGLERGTIVVDQPASGPHCSEGATPVKLPMVVCRPWSARVHARCHTPSSSWMSWN